MAPEVKTIREWLSPLGLDALKIDAGLDLEDLAGAPRFYGSHGTGALQVSCGTGLVILGMPMFSRDSKGCLFGIRHSALVILDDAEGHRWDVRRQQEGDAGWNKGPSRPWAVLRLVISA